MLKLKLNNNHIRIMGIRTALRFFSSFQFFSTFNNIVISFFYRFFYLRPLISLITVCFLIFVFLLFSVPFQTFLVFVVYVLD